MVEGRLDTGEKLVALNELFVGHRSHQSARYRLALGDTAEDHSSSGLIVATGTGATGWARSIMEATGQQLALAPQERAVGYFVREPFPSIATGTSLRARSEEHTSELQSLMRISHAVFRLNIKIEPTPQLTLPSLITTPL